MSIWVNKVGFPVIKVTETESGIHIQQNRFLQTADATNEEDNTLYPIFLALRTKEGVRNDLRFETRTTDVPLVDKDFFKLNADSCGFYRTLYTPERHKKLSQAMKSGLLLVEDRIGLIADAGALASSGYQKTSSLLEYLANLGDESDSLVWNQILSRLDTLEDAWKFENERTKNALKALKRQVVVPPTKKLGWTIEDGEDPLLTEQKASMFQSAGLAGDLT